MLQPATNFYFAFEVLDEVLLPLPLQVFWQNDLLHCDLPAEGT